MSRLLEIPSDRWNVGAVIKPGGLQREVWDGARAVEVSFLREARSLRFVLHQDWSIWESSDLCTAACFTFQRVCVRVATNGEWLNLFVLLFVLWMFGGCAGFFPLI